MPLRRKDSKKYTSIINTLCLGIFAAVHSSIFVPKKDTKIISIFAVALWKNKQSIGQSMEIEEVKALTNKLKGDDFERTVIEAYRIVFTNRKFAVGDTEKVWHFLTGDKMDNGYFTDNYIFYVSGAEIFLKFTDHIYIYKTFYRQAENNDFFTVHLETLDGKGLVLRQVEEAS